MLQFDEKWISSKIWVISFFHFATEYELDIKANFNLPEMF